LLTNGGRIMFEQLLVIDKKNTYHEFKNVFPMAAKYPFNIEFYSLNYKGLDYVKDFSIDVKESSEDRTVISN
jgi:hypothetical protein